jgi:hypothetical protein
MCHMLSKIGFQKVNGYNYYAMWHHIISFINGHN